MLLPLDDAGGVEIRLTMPGAVESDVIIGVPDGSPTVAIAEHTGRGLEDIGTDVSDSLRRLPARDPHEHLLSEIFELGCIGMFSPEIMNERGPKLEGLYEEDVIDMISDLVHRRRMTHCLEMI